MDVHIQGLPLHPAALHRRSPGLIASHHQNNHGEAVKRLIASRAQLASVALAAAPGLQPNGLKREDLIAINSMLLDPACTPSLDANFGAAAGASVYAFMNNIDWAAAWQAAGRPLAAKPARRTP